MQRLEITIHLTESQQYLCPVLAALEPTGRLDAFMREHTRPLYELVDSADLSTLRTQLLSCQPRRHLEFLTSRLPGLAVVAGAFSVGSFSTARFPGLVRRRSG